MSEPSQRGPGPDGQALLLAAGLVDLAVTGIGATAGALRGLLRRADTAELARDAERDLLARGRLALDRYAAVPPAHLEVLARHARSRSAARAAAGSDG